MPEAEGPTREQCAAVIEGYRTAWQRQDPVMMGGLFAPDGVFIDPGFAPYEGLEAVLSWYRPVLDNFVDPDVEYVRVAVDPPVAMGEWISRLTRKSDGNRYAFHGISVFELDAGGKVVLQRDYYDTDSEAYFDTMDVVDGDD